MPPYCQLAGKKETDVRRAVGVVLVVLCLLRRFAALSARRRRALPLGLAVLVRGTVGLCLCG